jgi:flagellar hook-length control protein FliK
MMPALSFIPPTLFTMPVAAVPAIADTTLFSAALLAVTPSEMPAPVACPTPQAPPKQAVTVPALAVTDLLAQFPDDDTPLDIVAAEMPEGVVWQDPTLAPFAALAGQRSPEPTPPPTRQPTHSAKGLTEPRIIPTIIDTVPLPVSPTPMTRENAQPIKLHSTSPTMPIDAQPIERHLDLARDSLWLDSLARDIVAAGDGGGRLSFRLSPPTLGALDVSITPRETGVAVAMTTSTEDAARIIGASTARLVDDLRAQGLRVASADVTADNAQSQHRAQHETPPSQFIETGFVSDDMAHPAIAQPSGRFA